MKLTLISVAAVVFALAFMAVGVMRIVEFDNLGLSAGRKRLLVVLHVTGCALFSCSLAFVGIDVGETGKKLAYIFLVFGLGFLAPGQYTMGTLRRRQIDQHRKGQSP